MKVATHSLGFERYPIDKVFEIAERTGFDGIELSGQRPHGWVFDMDTSAIDHLYKLRETHHLEIPVYSPGLLSGQYSISTHDENVRQESIEYVLQCIRFTKDAGIPSMLINSAHAGYGTSRRENVAIVMESLKPILDAAEKCGIDIIMEPVAIFESNTMTTSDDLAELMEDLPHPRLVTMIDTAPPFCQWEPYADYFEKLGDKIKYIHFVDCNGVNEAHLRPGRGCLPMLDVLKVMKRFGYNGWLCIEILAFRDYKRDVEMYCGKDIKVMRQLLQEAGYK